MNDYIKFIETQIQVKKHIFITGTRGSGKTTLIHELKDKLGSNDSILRREDALVLDLDL